MRSRSASPVTSPTPRTVYRSARCSMNPPLNDWLSSATRAQHVGQDQSVLLEPRRIDHQLELLGQAAPRVDFAHPWHRA